MVAESAKLKVHKRISHNKLFSPLLIYPVGKDQGEAEISQTQKGTAETYQET